MVMSGCFLKIMVSTGFCLASTILVTSWVTEALDSVCFYFVCEEWKNEIVKEYVVIY